MAAASCEEPNRVDGEHRGEPEEVGTFCNDGDNADDNSAAAAPTTTASTGPPEPEPEQDYMSALPPADTEGCDRDGGVDRRNSSLQTQQVDDADGRTDVRLESATSLETVTDDVSCSTTPSEEPASSECDDENDDSCRGGGSPQVIKSEERAEGSQSKDDQHVPPEHTTSPQAPPLPNQPSPDSQKKRESTDGTEFGEFVSRTEEAWNPFDGGDICPTEFCIDEDDEPPMSATLAFKRKASTSSQSKQEELDSLRRVFDSEYERALEDQDISWKARYGATRLSFLVSALMMVAYLWLGCMFYSSEADWSIPDALLFTVYTVTTVGYGGPQPLPNTAAFHAFTSFYVIAGISLVTVLGAHTYQLVTLEANRIRANPWRKRRQSAQGIASDGFQQEQENANSYREQFMNELEDFTKQQPFLEAFIARLKSFRTYLRTTKSGKVLAVVLPFVGMILLGAIVVGTIEEWTPLESIYWSIVTLTTVGYGDYVPTKDSSVWFCTLFFVPTSLFFLSFLLAHVANTYIRLHAIHVARLEKKMRRKNERRRMDAERAEKARRNAEAAAGDDHDTSSTEQSAQSNDSPNIDSMEGGFTTMFTTEDDDAHGSPTKTTGLFGDQTGNIEEGSSHSNQFASDTSPGARYRENIIRNKFAPPDSNGRRVVTFAEALKSLNTDPTNSDAARQLLNSDATSSNSDTTEETGIPKPALELRLRVQARLARIIAEEVAGYHTGVVIKGFTVSLTVGSLRDTSEKWKIPPQAWKAFRAVAFRSLLFVGERELIAEGGDALLHLNVVEFHNIFSPMLAAMGDRESMETWLAATDILADVELRGGSNYGKKLRRPFGTFT